VSIALARGGERTGDFVHRRRCAAARRTVAPAVRAMIGERLIEGMADAISVAA
jgi:hypothetical protein